MTAKKQRKFSLKKAIFGGLFALISLFGLLSVTAINSPVVYADPEPETATETVIEAETTNTETTHTSTTNVATGGDSCKDSLGAIGWLVCPTTGKIAEAVDWLYDKIESILIINPIPAEDGSPIFEVWKYIRGVTNIVFIIFLLIVIYSQITGLGINNYGIKKALPKLIVAAILVNLSFYICQLGVDISNIVGDSLRGVFSAVSEAAIVTNENVVADISYTDMFSAITAGVGVGIVAFEFGAIWMLIPVVLGALVAVVTGLITIALRQAVVALLIMIAPLAMVANILPNTEKWFKKWKDLLIKMLIFYPMFSLLFGASQLAGFAIIASAKDGFGLLLGSAVEIFPLFFSWSLMKMSGTFLNTINTKLNSLASSPLATNRAWADSHRQLSRARHLEQNRMPSARLMNFLAFQKTRREADTDEINSFNKTKYMAGRALKSYDKDGNLSKSGRKEYNRQALSMRYAQIAEMHKDNLNEGFGGHSAEYKSTIAEMKKDFQGSRGDYATLLTGGTFEEQIGRLDKANMDASDDLKSELARGAKIEYENAKSYHKRVADAITAHEDFKAYQEGNIKHKFHNLLQDNENIARYERMRKIMEGKEIDTHFVGADAAHSFNAQAQVVRGKFRDYFDYTAPTKDVVNLLSELTKSDNSNDYIDPIIAGLRTLNMRGDTDLVRAQIDNLLANKKVELGTYTSQSLANFLMFDVKDNDPMLRRFGKYINLETAKMFDEPKELKDRRTRKDVSLYEYINGEYIDEDEDGNVIYDSDGKPKKAKPKRSAEILLNGTSFKGMERTAIANMIETIRDQSYDIDENGEKKFNYEKFRDNEGKLWNSIMANIISDQFSFLSGSEQIVALGKGLTGVDVKKHRFAWEDIFGENAKNLTDEEKRDYIKTVHDRTKTFLGGHVPVQIARTKTDMLEAIRTQYTLNDIVNSDPNSLSDIGNPKFERDKDSYKKLEDEHLDEVRKEFVGSFKPDALKGFTKMYQKGYQGEAKDGLIRLLNPDELYKQYFPNGTNERNRRERREFDDDDDEDDGMPVGGEVGEGLPTDSNYSQARADFEKLTNEYRGSDYQVDDYWREVKDTILPQLEYIMDDYYSKVEMIERSLKQYNIDTLRQRIDDDFFGGR